MISLGPLLFVHCLVVEGNQQVTFVFQEIDERFPAAKITASVPLDYIFLPPQPLLFPNMAPLRK